MLLTAKFDKDGFMDQSFENRYEAIIQATADIICEVSNDKIYTWMNEAGLHFFGHDVLGKSINDYLWDGQETYHNIQPQLKERDKIFCIHSWHRRQDGQRRLLAWWRRILRNAQGEMVGFLYTGRDITERKLAEKEKDCLIDDLKRRNQELNCLFAFSELVEQNLPLSKLYAEFPQIIAKFWQHPQQVAVCLRVKDEIYQCEDFRKGKNNIVEDLVVGKKVIGHLEICYRRDELVFGVEECRLLNILGGSLAKTIKRMWIEEEIEQERAKLKEANIALKNLLSDMRQERQRVKENIALNLNKRVLPLIERLKGKNNNTKWNELTQELTGLSDGFHRRLVLQYDLTEQEINVCQWIKQGLGGKEIAQRLNISYLTVEGHKKNIRRKLKLTGKKSNLRTFLSELL